MVAAVRAAPACEVEVTMRSSRPVNAGTAASADQMRVTRPPFVTSSRSPFAEATPSDGVLCTPPAQALPPAGMVQR